MAKKIVNETDPTVITRQKLVNLHTRDNKAPLAEEIFEGEIAVNANKGNEHLYIKNENSDLVAFIPEHTIVTKLEAKQNVNDEALETNAKTIVGAINEVRTSVNNATSGSVDNAELTGDVTSSLTPIEDKKFTIATTIANDAITTAKILNKNVTADKLATDSVITDKIKDGNVTAVKLGENAVTTVKIADANVTDAKIESVDGKKINKLTDYAKPASYSAIGASDTLNTALGKLEAGHEDHEARIIANENAVGALSSATHFIGVKTELPVGQFESAAKGDIVIVGSKEYIYNAEISDNTYVAENWAELGDTSAETQRIGNLENTVNGTAAEGEEPTNGLIQKVAKLESDIIAKQNASDDSLTTNNKTIVTAINELDSEISDLSTLKTTANSSVVAAINEIFDSDSQNSSDITSIKSDKQDKTDNSLETTAKTIAGAINEINTDLGNKEDAADADGSAFARIAKNASDISTINTNIENIKVSASGDTYVSASADTSGRVITVGATTELTNRLSNAKTSLVEKSGGFVNVTKTEGSGANADSYEITTSDIASATALGTVNTTTGAEDTTAFGKIKNLEDDVNVGIDCGTY